MNRIGWAVVGLTLISLGSIHNKLGPGDVGMLVQALGLALFLQCFSRK